MRSIDKTLAEHLRISAADIADRKRLLGLTASGEAALAAFLPTVEGQVDQIVAEFYDFQLSVPEIRAIISDADTLSRVKSAMRGYVLRLFSGSYEADYVNARLRIGKIHARIGVSPKLYIASMHRLEMILSERGRCHGATPDLLAALQKLFLFDLQLVFDTYIQGLMSEVENAHAQLEDYAETLERQVAERTAEIARVARTDPLTGLDNRREFFHVLADCTAAADAARSTLALGFFDANDFKAINDRFGHLHGDRVLARIGTAMKKAFAGTGRVFRYGGDEFCVVMPDTSEAQACAACAAFCESLTGEVAFSYGVACLQPGDRDNLERLVARADAAMYSDKALPTLLPREA